jgi:RHS repeat-associated protein
VPLPLPDLDAWPVRWADGDINHEGITFPTEGDRESWDDVGRRVPVSVGRPGSSVGRPDFGGGEFVGLGSGDHAGWSPGARTDPVTVTISGTGSGALTTVTSSPGGITCAGSTVSCTGWFQEGTSVTLTATVGANGPTFLGWTGACSGTGSCVLFIQGSQTVGAVFGTGLEFYHLDAIGSVRMVTNAAGAVVKRNDYFAFGEDIAAMTGDPRRFTGKELDPETALHYFGARYYRNLWGRFTSVDPVMDVKEAIRDPERWNRYGYARNGPLRFTDPDGRNPLAVAGIVVGVLIVLQEPLNAPGPDSSLFDGLTNLVEIGETVFYAGLSGAWGRYVMGPLFGRASTTVAAARKVGGKSPTTGKQPTQAQYKVRKPGVSGKEGATDVPDWARGERPFVGENGREFAKRVLDTKYGEANYRMGPNTEFNKIQKFGDRAFMDPPGGR